MSKHATSCLLLSLVAVLLVSGCAVTLTPVTGFIYSDVKGPLQATSNEGSMKTGTSEATSILGLVGTGDASIEAAMKDGKITKIHHVDYHTKNILALYAKLTVIVYGE